MAIITISRQFCSNGDNICAKLSEKYGYKLVGRKILKEKMMEYGCPESVILRYDGKKPSFFDNFSREKDEYLYYLKSAILSEATNGNCIIIGRGSFLVLKDIQNTVSIRILEPRKNRCERLLKKHPELNEKLAMKIVKKADWHQFGFHRSFFGFRFKDNFIYDAIFNSSNADEEVFANTIHELVKSKVTSEKEELGKEQLNELTLGQNIVNMLNFTYNSKIDNLRAIVYNKSISSSKTVLLQGVASSSADVEKVINILSLELPEFSVKSEIRIVQDYLRNK